MSAVFSTVTRSKTSSRGIGTATGMFEPCPSRNQIPMFAATEPSVINQRLGLFSRGLRIAIS
jgi:hypothetical protein